MCTNKFNKQNCPYIQPYFMRSSQCASSYLFICLFHSFFASVCTMSSSSSSRVFVKKYDVFISFRGEDTRDNFTSHLYSALKEENIVTYIDYELERGDDIWPALVKAIKDSMMAIVVFSERYATSKWCLQELAQIMECKRVQGQVVLPVFYKTIPTDVRKQTGSYKKPFEDYDKKEDQNKVYSWRNALTEAANISGYESSGDDSQVIRNMVKYVLGKLHSMQYDYQEGLVGIEEQCEAIKGSSGELGRRIGLWGMGGTGKTTIAKALFNEYCPEYDSVCFLENVREESQIHGLTHIRDELLSQLLKEQVTISNFSGSTHSSRKVLIVLDDVDSYEQLESLCVGFGDLGEGSSIIVTTRDKHLLREIVDIEIYEVKPLDFEKSLVLFSLAAFNKREPDNAYEDLSRRVVEYARGFPFVLQLLGSYFYSKKNKFWESELSYLETRKKSFKEIQNVFKVSYHGLSKQEKEIFLDIAFFFKDRNEDSVISILDACGFDAAREIEKLKDKALITISKTKTIQMHDFIQDMAFEIGIADPTRGRILTDRELNGYQGTQPEDVERALFDLSREYKFEFNAGIFDLPKLRILRFYIPVGKELSASISFKDFLNNERGSTELKYFEWTGYPCKSLPTNLCVKFLVEIRMRYSSVKRLWEGKQDIVNLETIDLSECRYLECLPDLSTASKLKWVYLSGCRSITSLKIEKHLSNLQELNAYDCRKLEEFSGSSDSIKRLNLSGPRSQAGEIWFTQSRPLNNLTDALSCLTSLEELRISNCQLMDKMNLHVLCAALGSLKLLHLKDCKELLELPDNISALSSLHELRLNRSNVKNFPTSIKLLEKLEILSLKMCSKLEFLPELPLLIKELNADGCDSLETVSTLKTFSVKMKGMEKHVSFMHAKKPKESSLLQIMEDTMFAMKRAQLCNVFVRSSVAVCFPGRSVPSGSGQGLFAYRSKGSSITIEPHDRSLSHWLGTIYAVALSKSYHTRGLGKAKVGCRIYGKDGECNTTWFGKDFYNSKSENVFIWHGSSFDDAIVFEFFVTASDKGKVVGEDVIECGIYLNCCSNSELQSLIGEAELELEIKSEWPSALDLREDINQKEVNLWQREDDEAAAARWVARSNELQQQMDKKKKNQRMATHRNFRSED